MFKKDHFDDLTRKFLFLAPDQNATLMKNIETEDLFKPYETNQRYQNIFRLKNQLVSVIRQFRITARPLVLALSHSTDLARHTRAAGESLGYKYPEQPAEINMRGPTPVQDYLTPTEDSFMALPHMLDPTDGVENLDSVQLTLLNANHTTNLTELQKFHEAAVKAVRNLYDGVLRVLLG